jgi:GNAT superfamily N-acetyltransferase
MPDRLLYATPTDPLARPLVEDLIYEYESRYSDIPGREPAVVELHRYAPSLFAPPDGNFLLLLRDDRAIAGDAFMRLDATTAKMKRVWTERSVRRQGIARLILAELEGQAVRQGYRLVFLTTGFRQPEAKNLYLTSGYRALSSEDDDLAALHEVPFEKEPSVSSVALRKAR